MKIWTLYLILLHFITLVVCVPGQAITFTVLCNNCKVKNLQKIVLILLKTAMVMMNFTQHVAVGQIERNYSNSCGLVLSADILHKMASSVQNAKLSIVYRKSTGKCEPEVLGENVLNMTSVQGQKLHFYLIRYSIKWPSVKVKKYPKNTDYSLYTVHEHWSQSI